MSSLREPLLFAMMVIVISSCTHTHNPPRGAYTGYSAGGTKLPLIVGLNITGELKTAKWERESLGDTWVIPIGESVAMNAGVLARHLFVRVVDLGKEPSAVSEVDAILTPLVVHISRTFGATSFGESIFAIKIEWNLTTRSGKPIWIETVNGQSSGSTGWSDQEKILKEALEAVLIASEKAFRSSQSILRFVALAERPKSAVTDFGARPTETATHAEGGRAELTDGQRAVARQLIGTWQGSVTLRRPSQRDTSSRTLVISSVRMEGNKLVALGDYAITGRESSPVMINVDEEEGALRLSLTTGAGSQIGLGLRGNSLTGSFVLRPSEVGSIQLDRVE